MSKKLKSFFSSQKGVIQLPVLIGLLILAVALPAATRLVQQRQEIREKAEGECPPGCHLLNDSQSGFECGASFGNKRLGGTSSQTVERSNEQSHSGAYSLRVDYQGNSIGYAAYTRIESGPAVNEQVRFRGWYKVMENYDEDIEPACLRICIGHRKKGRHGIYDEDCFFLSNEVDDWTFFDVLSPHMFPGEEEDQITLEFIAGGGSDDNHLVYFVDGLCAEYESILTPTATPIPTILPTATPIPPTATPAPPNCVNCGLLDDSKSGFECGVSLGGWRMDGAATQTINRVDTECYEGSYSTEVNYKGVSTYFTAYTRSDILNPGMQVHFWGRYKVTKSEGNPTLRASIQHSRDEEYREWLGETFDNLSTEESTEWKDFDFWSPYVSTARDGTTVDKNYITLAFAASGDDNGDELIYYIDGLCAEYESILTPTATPIPPECINNEDCDDDNLCTTDTCVSGSCEYTPISCNDHAECDPSTGDCQCSSDNWGDCDSELSNGCEADLTDETSCGVCGNQCDSDEICRDKECVKVGEYPTCLINQMAEDLGIDIKYILSIEDVSQQWSSSCLGCPEENEMCAMVMTAGKKLVLKSVYPDSNSQCWQYEYHTASIHCDHYRLCQEQEIDCSQCPANGDFNGDGKVDEFDYGILIAHFGNEGVPGEVVGDANCDGVVDEFDYGILIAHFGEGE